MRRNSALLSQSWVAIPIALIFAGCAPPSPRSTAAPNIIAPTLGTIVQGNPEYYSISAGVLDRGWEATPHATVVSPIFINHERPDLEPGPTLEEVTGCELHDETLNTFLSCDTGRVDIRCDAGQEIFQKAQGLAKGGIYIVSTCHVFRMSEQPPEEYIYLDGCATRANVGYVIWHEGEFEEVMTQQRFQELFSPIESPGQALVYATLITGLFAAYGHQFDLDARYYATTIEDTYVVEERDHYRVHLYHHEFCSCAPHVTSSVDVLVGKDGIVVWDDVAPLYDFGPTGGCRD